MGETADSSRETRRAPVAGRGREIGGYVLNRPFVRSALVLLGRVVAIPLAPCLC
jgi:hypothetical protein